MAIITISRGSFSKGQEVAEKVAARLGYTCISREVLLDASDHFKIDEIKLIRAIHDAPSILKRFSRDKRTYIAYIQCALTQRVKGDGVVYHGLAGHLLLKGVPHVLKVRVIANLEDRVASEMAREGVSKEEARSLILKDDEERRKWTKSLYGVDPWDSNLYDLVVHIDRLTVEDAVDFICQAAQREAFNPTPESQQKMDDLALSCLIKAELVEHFPDVAVTSEYGNVLVYAKGGDRQLQKLRKKTRELRQHIEGINNLEVHAETTPPPNAV
ncbi:MAG: cytidylate kinase-like family protein [Deltaproteobacteria bacterium]|nr:cytidylate kinase-like family protein [Deltaproteobacteria bacterium]MBW2017293.1 cytidylate kinase-like family protein [Deltaproteobacteria bacterium]MBW2129741.1 cytidylate kinase-like family protein [Deltaproteobacteria bacterium]MBW2304344.1 cytidylate kinase-like family protein [Deltaproteobacteria bacterium]